MLIVSPKAEWDIIEAIAYYAKIDNNLGIKLRDELSKVISNISSNPLMYPIIYKSYRRALTRNYSYALYYTIEENNNIIIDAVFSQRVSLKLLKLRLD